MRVTYADESFDLVGVNFEVQDNQPPVFTARIPNQYFFSDMEINPIAIPVTDNVGVVSLSTNKDGATSQYGAFELRFDGVNMV